ncbi:DeoR/GlpR family DNA-binding transcription regulator [Streptomyces winkii]|uniref:DeoR/GlpR family DNA-binding transcription regulator n=1 Tax=Streptomyces winkii TaxID=3051178 RepID=UPI0028D05579|nr:DeoR/GlpR family DNA-binding transcription regulator [Streptomyces sp. DSM 40971]
MPGIAEHERQQEVLRLLEGTGRVSVPELAERLGVSVVTVRKDLDALERRRILRRVRGGAVAVRGADEGAFEMRVRYRVPEKQAIARAAAEHVRDGDAIVLDCSTTCYHLAREIRDRSGLIVVTNGLRAAEVLSESDATVVMPGGTLRRSSWSLVGEFGEAFNGRGRVARGFFGLRSLSPELGLLELSAEETEAKRVLVSICDEVYGLFDSGKVGRFALHTFAPSDRITALVTEGGAPDELVEQWRAVGVPVRRAPVQAEAAT